MKWFTHDNDLSKSPRMQFIIAELGVTGYGQACILLEVLSRETENDGNFQFQLPLAKTTDLRFWARELHLTVSETEHTLDIFEQGDLILPWRETQVVSAPMLGERVDEWSKRKRKASRPKEKEPETDEHGNEHTQEHENQNEHTHQHQHQHKHNSRVATEQLPSNYGEERPVAAAVVCDSFSTPLDGHETSSHDENFSDAREVPPVATKSDQPSDSEIMALFYDTMFETVERRLNSTVPHQKAAVAFFRKYGSEVALQCWHDYLETCPQVVDTVDVYGEPLKEWRKWPLHDFISSGVAEDYAREILEMERDENASRSIR